MSGKFLNGHSFDFVNKHEYDLVAISTEGDVYTFTITGKRTNGIDLFDDYIVIHSSGYDHTIKLSTQIYDKLKQFIDEYLFSYEYRVDQIMENSLTL